MSTFKALSLSYKNAPIHIREQVALNEEECKALLQMLRNTEDLNDMLVLSTCNRTEVYYSASRDYSSLIVKHLLQLKGLDKTQDYARYFTAFNTHHEALQHLFYVATGLDAQVVGDLQISNQVKNAYQYAADAGTAGPFLHRLMHTIFFTNKRVVQETSFRSGAASTSYAAVELVEELLADTPNPKVLVLGVGEIGADVFLNLKNTSIEDLNICNRTIEKAQALAEGSRAKVIPFDRVNQALAEADVVISSVQLDEPFIDLNRLAGLKVLSYKYFIDLSVPRSVSPDVENIDGVLVYNIDNIKNKASQALEKRLQAVPDVKAIIAQSLEEFGEWSKEMDVSPVIKKLKAALEQIRLEEVERYMKELNEEESKKVDKITKSMMQKILKLPVLQLKAACKRGEAETLIDVLNDLFDLEKQAFGVK